MPISITDISTTTDSSAAANTASIIASTTDSTGISIDSNAEESRSRDNSGMGDISVVSIG